MSEIAAAIGWHKSTISRELRRNCNKRSGRHEADRHSASARGGRRGSPTMCGSPRR